MVSYVEEYKFGGRSYAIEDYEDGLPDDQHFFASDYPNRRKRFNLWTGGGGFGQADNLQEARRKLYDYAAERMGDDLGKHEAAVRHLKEDFRQLAAFVEGKLIA